ncbi:hypothetical protein [Streptomyces sp. t39]|uniref:hypothetical protein n=1 Tax=Streptomyces sp. t39 TaxID=1828156 RepID=UPI00164F8FB7|nr:hypothetical protein [Streptomyces sp. t39]
MSDQARPPALKSLPAHEQPVLVTGIRPGLHVRTDAHRPVADWLCRCGHHERAVGRWAVIELTGRVNVQHCPRAADAPPAPATEGAEVAARQGVRKVTDLPLPTTAAPADRRTAA